MLITPMVARRKNENGIIDLIINLKGRPPGSGLDSKITNESVTNGMDV